MEFTFEQLPAAISGLYEKLEKIEQLLENKQPQPTELLNQLMTIQQAAAFLSLSVPTIYGHVHNSLIPHSKKGKRLYFNQSELSQWIAQGRKKTTAEIAVEAQTYINRKNKVA